MNDAWNHALLTISLFAAWAVGLAFIGGSKIFWDFDNHKEDEVKVEPTFDA